MKTVVLILAFILISSSSYSFGIIFPIPATERTWPVGAYAFSIIIGLSAPVVGVAGIIGTTYLMLRTKCEKYEIKLGTQTRAEEKMFRLYHVGAINKELYDDAMLILDGTEICMTRTQFIIMFEALEGLKTVHTTEEIDRFFDFINGL